MFITLIFSLLLVHNNLSRKDPRHYKCHVEKALEIPGSVRSLNIFLQAPGIAATKGKLSRTQKVITLECFSLQNPVQVNVLYLERMHGDLTNQTVKKCTLLSLRVTASADRKPALSHTCLLRTHHQQKFQRKLNFRQKVFLAGTLNYVTRAKLPKLKVSAEGLTIPHVHQKNRALEKSIPPTNDKDMLNRQNISIVITAFIAYILLVFAMLYLVTRCEVTRLARRKAARLVTRKNPKPSSSMKPTHEKPQASEEHPFYL